MECSARYHLPVVAQVLEPGDGAEGDDMVEEAGRRLQKLREG
jgi:hypothetical protein